jgi:hypothetical protein
MSAQINLYHPRFLKQRELLTLLNVVLAAIAVYSLLALVGGWAWQNANTKRESATAAEAQLKLTKDQVDAAIKSAATRKPNPQLAAELEGAESMLRRREEIARLLESGVVGSTGGFSEYMRGFARQAQDGLWLTGFSIGSGGNDMEIRGSMLNPGALPDYIRRLGAEKAFQGRNFAALSMNRPDQASGTGPATSTASPAAATAAPVQAVVARPINFVLLPSKANDAKAAKP